MKKALLLLVFVAISANAQYWQQKTDYKMDIDMDVKTYQYLGKQKITYKNNSPETLTKVYFHLYNNAFQPGSAMDVKIQNMVDPDRRVVTNVGTKEAPINQSRIAMLKPEEEGYLKIKKLSQKGTELTYSVQGTILEVELAKAIKPGKKTSFEVEFEGQVPKQIRRSGRESKEGVTLSMTQWYPKLAAYDDEGWHANPYLGAEFYADWGDYEVNITIDKDYTIGGTGYLQNPQEIGHGYENSDKKLKQEVIDGKLTWKFKAPNVHDFSWAADNDYEHLKHQVPNGPEVHFLYKNSLSEERKTSWGKLPKIMDKLFGFYNSQVGVYPYKQYTVVQGGDGGMEYAMCTLITGDRNYESLVGVVAHELAHTWFQFLLASNETKHAWMDEGSTTYISTLIESQILENDEASFGRVYNSYLNLATSGKEQPMTTHGDAFDYGFGYGISSYSKGSLFVFQLGYVIGKEALQKTLKDYFKAYSFKHPKPEDFIRVAEKASGIELDWYLNYWTRTTKTIDYEVIAPITNKITISRKGKMPMPIELKITYTDNSEELIYIPLDIMRGQKKLTDATVLNDWAWAKPTYGFEAKKDFKKIEIDPNQQMMDVDRTNNVWVKK
ncbi:M1 family metallopeptidase [Wenyingzhuangia sp. 2_MG-2023]|uniref:M1 family metallopeptidase n=1 Tax=Wenyingzhuangia sp. 2_MG-2023 TaxID=3062639 RepID=UPI0026E14AE5|nr:M1 family metallopeptidase [Wenyingzhuangia sp. 2_MG-2023]MDO6736741.1 M1 family metallopeptidase [Wenyingzhuangia sp. 2_MG-2023]